MLENRQTSPSEPTSVLPHIHSEGLRNCPVERKESYVFCSTRPTENIFLSASHSLTTPRTAFLGHLPLEAPTTQIDLRVARSLNQKKKIPNCFDFKFSTESYVPKTFKLFNGNKILPCWSIKYTVLSLMSCNCKSWGKSKM